MSTNNNQSSCSCGGLIFTIFLLWALWVGLPTPWGKLHIDLFPPAIELK